MLCIKSTHDREVTLCFILNTTRYLGVLSALKDEINNFVSYQFMVFLLHLMLKSDHL